MLSIIYQTERYTDYTEKSVLYIFQPFYKKITSNTQAFSQCDFANTVS